LDVRCWKPGGRASVVFDESIILDVPGLELRRAGWVAIGWLGIYAAAIGVAYLVGPIYILLVLLAALVLARLRQLDHLIAVVACVLIGPWVVVQLLDGSTGGSFILGSVLAMTLAAAKLGRIAGHRIWKN
jgi:hypothetical protein